MNHNTTPPPSNMKRSKKPMPLFGLFRKNKPDPMVPLHHQQQQQLSPLGSGISSVPFNSMLSPTFYHQQQQQHQIDPYAPPRIPKPSVSDSRRPTRQQPQQQQQPPQQPPQQQQQQQQQRQRTRQRSKSVGRDPSTVMLEERELALNKLCKREPPSSLADSLPLLSPTYKTTTTTTTATTAAAAAPPVPPIPLKHQPNNSMRKFSSAHDLRKAAKLQQESMNQQVPLPIQHHHPHHLSRSRSLSASPARRLHTSKSHQNLVKSPTTPTYSTRHYKKAYKPSDSDDDDDVPLGYLQSPTSKPSSLLSDQEEDDDKDLVPIAVLDIKPTEEFQTAADKYKLKVKERLQFDDCLSGGEEQDDDDDDDIPISLALMSPKWKKKEIKRF